MTGDTRKKELVKELKSDGIGRMVIGNAIRAYEGEKWGFDNGAYRDFINGQEFDNDAYLRRVDMAFRISERFHQPYFGVLPDIVCGGAISLDRSVWWLERGVLPLWHWYLVVQNGMSRIQVESVLNMCDISGLFLGGDDKFKATALYWAELAQKYNIFFHYGRCGTREKVNQARAVAADSCDSALPLFTESRFEDWLNYMNRDVQLEFWDLKQYARIPEDFCSA